MTAMPCKALQIIEKQIKYFFIKLYKNISHLNSSYTSYKVYTFKPTNTLEAKAIFDL